MTNRADEFKAFLHVFQTQPEDEEAVSDLAWRAMNALVNEMEPQEFEDGYPAAICWAAFWIFCGMVAIAVAIAR